MMPMPMAIPTGVARQNVTSMTMARNRGTRCRIITIDSADASAIPCYPMRAPCVT